MTDALRAAMVRFSTLDPSLWPRAFAALRALGFNTIDLPVVWRDHETAAGTIELTSGRRSLAAALDAVAAQGLRAIVRVGPMNAPDARGLGLPERVLWDRRFHARTRRQNPVLEPDLPRFVPFPSLSSVDFLREATTWVQTVCESLAPYLSSRLIARVVLGYGPYPFVRDEPWSADHHPDQGNPAQHYAALIDAAHRAGVDPRQLTVANPAGAHSSPLAATMSRDHRLAFAALPPSAGTASIWQWVRHGASMSNGSHWDLRAGSSPAGMPLRNAHAVDAARVATAAGARDYTVVMGCAGDRWAGALLDERAVPRAIATSWAALNNEAATLPQGPERAAALDAYGIVSDPPERVLVRGVTAEDGDALVVLSAWDEPVTLHPAEGWLGEGSVVAPGAVTVLRRMGGME